MHDTVVRTRKLVNQFPPREGVAAQVSQRLQAAGLSRALSEPLSTHFEILYRLAHGWVRAADSLSAPGKEDPAAIYDEVLFTSRHLATSLKDVVPFLDRAEDQLSEKEEITHRESGYEREVAPFARLDTTADFRGTLGARSEFGSVVANDGAQVLSDLLKIVYLENRLRDEMPKPGDLYAMVSELHLDTRRHLTAVLAEGSPFMRALSAAAGRPSPA